MLSISLGAYIQNETSKIAFILFLLWESERTITNTLLLCSTYAAKCWINVAHMKWKTNGQHGSCICVCVCCCCCYTFTNVCVYIRHEIPLCISRERQDKNICIHNMFIQKNLTTYTQTCILHRIQERAHTNRTHKAVLFYPLWILCWMLISTHASIVPSHEAWMDVISTLNWWCCVEVSQGLHSPSTMLLIQFLEHRETNQLPKSENIRSVNVQIFHSTLNHWPLFTFKNMTHDCESINWLNRNIRCKVSIWIFFGFFVVVVVVNQLICIFDRNFNLTKRKI